MINVVGEGSIYLCEERGEGACITKCKHKGTKHRHSFCPDYTSKVVPVSFRDQVKAKRDARMEEKTFSMKHKKAEGSEPMGFMQLNEYLLVAICKE